MRAQANTGGAAPHYLLGKNPFIGEMDKSYHIPVYAPEGGAETMYPEFRKKMKYGFVLLDKCTPNCGGRGPGPGGALPQAAAVHVPTGAHIQGSVA
jgi:hypothetical protein